MRDFRIVPGGSNPQYIAPGMGGGYTGGSISCFNASNMGSITTNVTTGEGNQEVQHNPDQNDNRKLDEHGRVIRENTVDPSFAYSGYTTYEYDDQGRVIRKIQHAGSLYMIEDFQYDEQHNRVSALGRSIHSNNSDRISHIRIEYEYDEADPTRRIGSKSYDSNGKLSAETKYEEDGAENITYYEDDGQTVKSRARQWRDDRGRPTTIHVMDDNNVQKIIEKEYNDEANTCTTKTTNANSKELSKITIRLDNLGREVARTTKVGAQITEEQFAYTKDGSQVLISRSQHE